jgi:cellulose biosynthesis protein BcsQ
VNTPSKQGKIVTFYSYKGGTGRSMALANVGWILASQGKKVLAIDWDLEAPGLHRYFHPFLEDKELTESQGLIDYVVEFAEAARQAHRTKPKSVDGSIAAQSWQDRYRSLLRYTYSLDWEFGEGTLDFVPAGQQGPSYALRVNGFDWREFYEKLGGGVLLEGLKERLRADYDYVLIDSRTGISDTSGICTVQMPDELVICFTLNQQSMKGAAAVAESADLQRRLPNGEPSLRIWPLPTRVDLAEKERLDAARLAAHSMFEGYLRHIPRAERAEYWDAMEVLYQAYYAYEEVLAVFADTGRARASILPSFEKVTRYVSGGTVTALRPMAEEDRRRGLEDFRRVSPSAELSRVESVLQPGRIFVAFAREDYERADRLARVLVKQLGPAVWWEGDEILPGDNVSVAIGRAFVAADVVLACFGTGWLARKQQSHRAFEKLLREAAGRAIRIVPVLLEELAIHDWRNGLERWSLSELGRLNVAEVSREGFDRDAERLAEQLQRILARSAVAGDKMAIPTDPDDPQRGRWGQQSSTVNRALTAEVDALSDDWFGITLTVEQTGSPPLEGEVEFHLHPTFRPKVRRVRASDGRATLNLSAWGAFTVGVSADGGRTMLELDLAADPSFPKRFRER